MPYARDLRLDTLNLEQDGGVLVARYESPPLNFMTSAFVDDWDHLTRAADRDGSVGAVVLTGEPEDRFITHFDVEELAATRRDAVAAAVAARGERRRARRDRQPPRARWAGGVAAVRRSAGAVARHPRTRCTG